MELAQKTQSLQKIIQKNTSPQTLKNPKKIYQDLVDILLDHNSLYYNQSAPIISDFEYDQLFSYLRKVEEYFPHLITTNSPTQNLENQLAIQEWFEKAKHLNSMLSLENTYNFENVKERQERVIKNLDNSSTWEDREDWNSENIKYILEPKFDGIAIEVIYQDRNFIQAITRGDGTWGEDVTENIKTIVSLPKILPLSAPWWKISFRGEILISKKKLQEINQEREKQWKSIYANTRNLASGSVKQLDPNITAKRELIAYIYEAYGFENSYNLYSLQDLGFNQELDKLTFFKDQEKKSYSSQEIISQIEYFSQPEQQELIHASEIEFDGLVIKVKDLEQRKKIGSTAHHPKRAVAYKFPAQQVATQIQSVDFQVGRTGIITPVANLQPVKLSGAMISRVSLHNFDFIQEKDIHYNDWIRLQRSGEVIPYVVGVIKERRETSPLTPRLEWEGEKWTKTWLILPPEKCPSCWLNLVQQEMHWYCKNESCPAQLVEKLIWFVSKNAMNIEWVWESIAEILVEQKIVNSVLEIYKILEPQTEFIIKRFPWFAEKKISEIKNQLKKSKENLPIWRLLNALWIAGIGKKTAQDIQKHLELMEDFQASWQRYYSKLKDKEILSDIYGLGVILVENIAEYFSIQTEILQAVEDLGFHFSPLEKQKVKLKKSEETKNWNQDWNQSWNQNWWNSFSITGTFPCSRNDIIHFLEEEGYEFHSHPKKTTNMMLIGEKAGSKKQKAESLGLEIFDTREKICNSFPKLRELETKVNKKDPQSGSWPIQWGLF